MIVIQIKFCNLPVSHQFETIPYDISTLIHKRFHAFEFNARPFKFIISGLTEIRNEVIMQLINARNKITFWTFAVKSATMYCSMSRWILRRYRLLKFNEIILSLIFCVKYGFHFNYKPFKPEHEVIVMCNTILILQ